MPYPDGYVSNVKMGLNQLEEYVDTVLGLREKYKDDIRICLGLEVEYYPAYFEELLEITGQYPIEYFLLGQHFLGNEIHDFYSGTPTSDERQLERYCSQAQEALETGCFTKGIIPMRISGKSQGRQGIRLSLAVMPISRRQSGIPGPRPLQRG